MIAGTPPAVPSGPSNPDQTAALAFLVHPEDITSGSGQVLQTVVLDDTGAVVTTSTDTVTLTVSSGTVALSGTLSAQSSSGVATFPSVVATGDDHNVVLAAQTSGLAEAISVSFDVTAGAGGSGAGTDGGTTGDGTAPVVPTSVRFVTSPTTATVGQPFNPAITVEVLDQFAQRQA